MKSDDVQRLFESSPAGLVAANLQGICTMCNPAAAAAFGLPVEQVLGTDLHVLFHQRSGSSRDDCAIAAAARGESRTAIAESFVRGDGNTVRLRYSAAPLLVDGSPDAITISVADVTVERLLEAQLEQANRVASLGRLTATLAHEFNNVLAGIAPFAEVIRRGRNVDAAVEQIMKAVARGKRITADVLRFTTGVEGTPAPLEVEPWFRDVAIQARSLLSGAHELTVIQEPGLSIAGDAARLQQVFTNLVLNARDAMPEGGTLTLEVRREAADARFSFGAIERPGEYAHFIVRDTGTGVPEDTRGHIFEPLFTTKKNGSGLGLAIAQSVVRAHRGEIFLESTTGEGTAFHIFLPLVAGPGRPQNQSSSAVAAPPSAQSVLVVEDDPAVAEGLGLILEMDGFEVETTDSGAAALDAVRRRVPDVVIMDVGLADQDGVAVHAEISRIAPSLPVIFMTGHGDRSRLEGLLRRRNVAFLQKPFAGEELVEAIRRVTGLQE